jgi:hypothetical protein
MLKSKDSPKGTQLGMKVPKVYLKEAEGKGRILRREEGREDAKTEGEKKKKTE